MRTEFYKNVTELLDRAAELVKQGAHYTIDEWGDGYVLTYWF